jgi:hypothetical protein
MSNFEFNRIKFDDDEKETIKSFVFGPALIKMDADTEETKTQSVENGIIEP